MVKRMAVLWCTLVLIMVSGAAVYSAETQQVEKKPVQVLNPEDAAKARSELQTLGVLFGVATEQKPAQQEQQTPEKPKTIAEVADKGLDMAGKLIGSIAATIEKAAPEVWRIMIKQQYAKAIGDLVVPWSMVVLLLAYMGVIRIVWKHDKTEPFFRKIEGKQDAEEPTPRFWAGIAKTAVPLVLLFLFLMWGANRLADSGKYLINPEYYAVRDIITMLLGAQHAPTP